MQPLWKKHVMALHKEGQLNAEFLLKSIAELSLDEETYKDWFVYSNKHKQVTLNTVFLDFPERTVNSLQAKSCYKISITIKRQ